MVGLSCGPGESGFVQGDCAWSRHQSTLGRVGWVNSGCWEVDRRGGRAGWGLLTITGGSQRLMCGDWVTPKNRTPSTQREDCFRVRRGENYLPKSPLKGLSQGSVIPTVRSLG